MAAPLFENGATAYTIQLPTTPASAEENAANELRDALKKISGIEFRIAKSDVEPSNPAVIIGSLETSPLIRARAKILNLTPGEIESTAVHTEGHNLVLAGNQPRGALYAVYAFLQRELGVRFFWTDGTDGTFFPPRSSFELPALKYNHTPSFQYRGFHLCYKQMDPEFETWMTRNFINIMRTHPYAGYNAGQKAKGMHLMVSNHFVNLPREVYEAHPEYFALVNGKRSPAQICWSSEGAFQALVNRLHGISSESPLIEMMSFFPDDNQEYCQCADCSKLDRSAAWFKYFNRLTEALKTRSPQLKFATIAYQGYLEAPKNGVLPENIEFLEYCQYDRCFLHRFDQACPYNAKSLERLKKWRETGVPLGIYGYEFDLFTGSFMMPVWTLFADEFIKFRELGIKSVITEVFRFDDRPYEERHTTRNRLGLYLYAQLLWNAEADTDALIADYCRYNFGPGAEAMQRYFKNIGTAWNSLDMHLSDYLQFPGKVASKFITPELTELAAGAFAEAKDMAGKLGDAGDRERILRNIALEQNYFQEYQKLKWNTNSGGNTVNLPSADSAKPFASPVELLLPKVSGPDRTTVKMSWTPDALMIRVEALEPDLKRVDFISHPHDTADLWKLDCVEIFLNTPRDIPNSYKQIIVSAGGSVLDMSCDTPYNGSPVWDSGAKVKPFRIAGGWGLEIALPFKPLGGAPKAGEEWRFAIGRSNAKSGTGAFPPESYHKPDAFASLYFNANRNTSKYVVWSNPLNDQRYQTLGKVFRERGFHYRFINNNNELYDANFPADIYVVRHNDNAIPAAEWAKIKQAVQNGALLVSAGYGEMYLDRYFNDPSLKLKWSGWEIDPERKHYQVPNGWMKDAVSSMIAPSNGWLPVEPGKWRTMGAIKMKDGKFFNYLMVRPYGKGMIVVTSGDMMASGGKAIFGNEQPDSVAELLDGLLTLPKR